jgi:gamma-glutamylputrescine oxidase
MRPSHTAQSYYQATANRSITCPALNGDVTTDVVIIGAGFTGISAALELAKAGYKVVVLEAGRIGSGASGRNGGQICTGFSAAQSKLAGQLGEADARKCFDISEDAKRLIETRIAEHNIDCDLRWGYMHCAAKPGQEDSFKAWKDEYDALGYTGSEIFTKQQLEERLGSKLYHGALREPRAGHFHPLNYLLGIADAAQKAGAVIYENSRVLEVDTSAAPWARTASGTVRSKFMIIGGNAYLGKTVPALYGRIMPVTSFIITTEVLGENMAKSLISNNEAVADNRFILDYFRRTADNRLLFGGRANYSTLEPTQLGAYMKPRLTKVFPQLQDVKIDHAWGGFIAITSNRIPDCGRLSPTTYYAHGYSGQGVSLAQMYGKLMAEAIRGTAEKFDLLARVKHLPFPGGALRTPLLVAAMLAYRLRDALG